MNGSQESPMFDVAPIANPITLTERKKCTKCEQIKEVSFFYADNRPRKNGNYMARCKLCQNKATKKYWDENPGAANAYMISFRINSPEKFKKAQDRYRNKVKSSGKGKLRYSISSSICHSLQKGAKSGRSWESLVGYSIEDLRKHLEKQFSTGMSWNNYGRIGWTIDHKVPVSVFNFQTPEDIDFKKCWALKNLIPMWYRDNIKKGDRLDMPFQPSLAIC